MTLNLTGPVTIRKTALIVTQPLPISTWERIGQQLAALHDSSAWWLADWLIYGESAYNGRYRKVIEQTGLGYQTLRNYAWVARRFEQPRRRANLSFAHHAEVAPLEPAEQDYWLRRAEEQSWSRNRLRTEVRTSLAERSPCDSRDDSDDDQASDGSGTAAIAIQVTLPSEAMERCEQVAMAHGLSVDAWVAQVLQSALRDFVTSGMEDPPS